MELPQPGVAMETSPPRFCMLSDQHEQHRPAQQAQHRHRGSRPAGMGGNGRGQRHHPSEGEQREGTAAERD